jgi:hypothetical protein
VACATHRTFYHLRRTLMAQGVARADVTPHLPLTPLFPWCARPARWRHWQHLNQLPLPVLRTSVAVFVALWTGTTAATWSLAPSWGQALTMGLCMAMIGDLYGIGRWALPARTLAELTIQVMTIQYRALLHPAMRNNRGKWRDVVLAGACPVRDRGLNAGRIIRWHCHLLVTGEELFAAGQREGGRG